MAHHHHHHWFPPSVYQQTAATLAAGVPGNMASYDPVQLFAQLGFEEGFRPKLYIDSRGNATIGYGHNLSTPMGRQTAKDLYDSDVRGCEASLDIHWPWWRSVDPVRQLVLMDMCFNLGSAGLGTFQEFLAAMRVGDWPTAAKDMMESKWEVQVGERALFLQEIILTGVVPVKRP